MVISVAPGITLVGGSLISWLSSSWVSSGLVFGWYTRKGSGINQHSYADLEDALPAYVAHDAHAHASLLGAYWSA
jgi:hypothetical protein